MKTTKVSPLNYLGTIITTMIVTSIILLFVCQLVCVSGSSMEPTYHHNDVLLIEKISNSYERFDVVVFKEDKQILIKRVIGVPGDDVFIQDGDVYINGELLDDVIDEYILDPGIAQNQIILRENEYFVLGDNRNNSSDSRKPEIGTISTNDVFGKVILNITQKKIIK